MILVKTVFVRCYIYSNGALSFCLGSGGLVYLAIFIVVYMFSLDVSLDGGNVFSLGLFSCLA